MDALLAESAHDLFAAACPPAAVRAMLAGDPGADAWAAIEQSGFPDALAPEASGGSGLSFADLAPLLLASGRHASPLPLAATCLVRGAFARAGQSAPAGPIAIGQALAGRRRAGGPRRICRRHVLMPVARRRAGAAHQCGRSRHADRAGGGAAALGRDGQRAAAFGRHGLAAGRGGGRRPSRWPAPSCPHPGRHHGLRHRDASSSARRSAPSRPCSSRLAVLAEEAMACLGGCPIGRGGPGRTRAASPAPRSASAKAPSARRPSPTPSTAPWGSPPRWICTCSPAGCNAAAAAFGAEALVGGAARAAGDWRARLDSLGFVRERLGPADGAGRLRPPGHGGGAGPGRGRTRHGPTPCSTNRTAAIVTLTLNRPEKRNPITDTRDRRPAGRLPGRAWAPTLRCAWPS